MDQIQQYRSRGARALVLMHEESLREFVATWRQAWDAQLQLPRTEDPSYESLEHLLWHVLRAARSYMTWMCKCLELGDPGIAPAPELALIRKEADGYLEYLLEKWREPLAGVDKSVLNKQTYESRWGVHYSIDAMLEHAVMHPRRHRFQLQDLLNTR